MRALVILELEVDVQSCFQVWGVRIVREVDVLVLDRAPQPLDEDIVQSPPPDVHADLDGISFQDAGALVGCELGPLVEVEERRHTLFQCLTGETIHHQRTMLAKVVVAWEWDNQC